MAGLLAQQHQNYKETTEPPSFRTIRNQAEWKSYNYRIKEETTSTLGKRGGDVEQAGPTPMCGR